MSYTVEDLETIAKKIRYDLTALQGKVTDLLNGIGEVAAQLPPSGDKPSCPFCELAVSASKLNDHIANVHGIEKVA